jgi:transmembrane sensor
MTNEENIKKWLAGELSEAERKDFEGTEEFARISKILEAVNHFKAPEYDVQGEYGRLTENRRRSGKRSSSQNILDKKKTISLVDRMRPVLKIAAILLNALTAGYFNKHQ